MESTTIAIKDHHGITSVKHVLGGTLMAVLTENNGWCEEGFFYFEYTMIFSGCMWMGDMELPRCHNELEKHINNPRMRVLKKVRFDATIYSDDLVRAIDNKLHELSDKLSRLKCGKEFHQLYETVGGMEVTNDHSFIELQLPLLSGWQEVFGVEKPEEISA